MKKASQVQKAYWEKQLKRYGLTEDAGLSDLVVYGHRVLTRDFDGRIAFKPSTKPLTGESSENEWPVSLC